MIEFNDALILVGATSAIVIGVQTPILYKFKSDICHDLTNLKIRLYAHLGIVDKES